MCLETYAIWLSVHGEMHVGESPQYLEKRISHTVLLTNHHIAIIVQMSRVVNSVFLEFSHF